MSTSSRNTHLLFRYGQCLNDGCSKCKSKEIQEIPARKDFVCQECGKEIILDNELIDQINVYQGRDITEENFENENPQVLEFMDMQISEQTFGKRLCSDCLKKYLSENNLI